MKIKYKSGAKISLYSYFDKIIQDCIIIYHSDNNIILYTLTFQQLAFFRRIPLISAPPGFKDCEEALDLARKFDLQNKILVDEGMMEWRGIWFNHYYYIIDSYKTIDFEKYDKKQIDDIENEVRILEKLESEHINKIKSNKNRIKYSQNYLSFLNNEEK